MKKRSWWKKSAAILALTLGLAGTAVSLPAQAQENDGENTQGGYNDVWYEGELHFDYYENTTIYSDAMGEVSYSLDTWQLNEADLPDVGFEWKVGGEINWDTEELNWELDNTDSVYYHTEGSTIVLNAEALASCEEFIQNEYACIYAWAKSGDTVLKCVDYPLWISYAEAENGGLNLSRTVLRGSNFDFYSSGEVQVRNSEHPYGEYIGYTINSVSTDEPDLLNIEENDDWYYIRAIGGPGEAALNVSYTLADGKEVSESFTIRIKDEEYNAFLNSPGDYLAWGTTVDITAEVWRSFAYTDDNGDVSTSSEPAEDVEYSWYASLYDLYDEETEDSFIRWSAEGNRLSITLLPQDGDVYKPLDVGLTVMKNGEEVCRTERSYSIRSWLLRPEETTLDAKNIGDKVMLTPEYGRYVADGDGGTRFEAMENVRFRVDFNDYTDKFDVSISNGEAVDGEAEIPAGTSITFKRKGEGELDVRVTPLIPQEMEGSIWYEEGNDKWYYIPSANYDYDFWFAYAPETVYSDATGDAEFRVYTGDWDNSEYADSYGIEWEIGGEREWNEAEGAYVPSWLLYDEALASTGNTLFVDQAALFQNENFINDGGAFVYAWITVDGARTGRYRDRWISFREADKVSPGLPESIWTWGRAEIERDNSAWVNNAQNPDGGTVCYSIQNISSEDEEILAIENEEAYISLCAMGQPGTVNVTVTYTVDDVVFTEVYPVRVKAEEYTAAVTPGGNVLYWDGSLAFTAEAMYATSEEEVSITNDDGVEFRWDVTIAGEDDISAYLETPEANGSELKVTAKPQGENEDQVLQITLHVWKDGVEVASCTCDDIATTGTRYVLLPENLKSLQPGQSLEFEPEYCRFFGQDGEAVSQAVEDVMFRVYLDDTEMFSLTNEEGEVVENGTLLPPGTKLTLTRIYEGWGALNLYVYSSSEDDYLDDNRIELYDPDYDLNFGFVQDETITVYSDSTGTAQYDLNISDWETSGLDYTVKCAVGRVGWDEEAGDNVLVWEVKGACSYGEGAVTLNLETLAADESLAEEGDVCVYAWVESAGRRRTDFARLELTYKEAKNASLELYDRNLLAGQTETYELPSELYTENAANPHPHHHPYTIESVRSSDTSVVKVSYGQNDYYDYDSNDNWYLQLEAGNSGEAEITVTYCEEGEELSREATFMVTVEEERYYIDKVDLEDCTDYILWGTSKNLVAEGHVSYYDTENGEFLEKAAEDVTYDWQFFMDDYEEEELKSLLTVEQMDAGGNQVTLKLTASEELSDRQLNYRVQMLKGDRIVASYPYEEDYSSIRIRSIQYEIQPDSLESLVPGDSITFTPELVEHYVDESGAEQTRPADGNIYFRAQLDYDWNFSLKYGEEEISWNDRILPGTSLTLNRIDNDWNSLQIQAYRVNEEDGEDMELAYRWYSLNTPDFDYDLGFKTWKETIFTDATGTFDYVVDTSAWDESPFAGRYQLAWSVGGSYWDEDQEEYLDWEVDPESGVYQTNGDVLTLDLEKMAADDNFKARRNAGITAWVVINGQRIRSAGQEIRLEEPEYEFEMYFERGKTAITPDDEGTADYQLKVNNYGVSANYTISWSLQFLEEDEVVGLLPETLYTISDDGLTLTLDQDALLQNADFLNRKEFTIQAELKVGAKTYETRTRQVKYVEPEEGGDSAENAIPIALKEVKTVLISHAGESHWYSFTPEINGEYVFSSLDMNDALAEVYLFQRDDERLNPIGQAWAERDGDFYDNLRLSEDLIAGETYYLQVKDQDEDRAGGSIDIVVTLHSLFVEDTWFRYNGVVNSTRELTVEAETILDEITYAWYDEENPDVILATAAVYTATFDRDKEIWCRISDGNEEETVSFSLIAVDCLTVDYKDEWYIRPGDSVMLKPVEIVSPDTETEFRYQWAKGSRIVDEDDEYDWIYENIPGATQSEYSVSWRPDYETQWYRLTVTQGEEEATAVFHVCSESDLWVRPQKKSVVVTRGEETELSVYAETDDDEERLTYRWYRGEESPENLLEESGSVLTVTLQGDQEVYTCVVSTDRETKSAVFTLISEDSVEEPDTLEKAVDIVLNETKTVFVAKSEDADERTYAYLRFIPETTGEYEIYSSADEDTRGYLLNSEMIQIAEDDDSGDNNNFKMTEELTAGETYFIKVRWYSYDNSGFIPVTVTRPENAHIHTYGEPEWSWSEDDGEVTATATFACTDCGETVTWNAEVVLDEEATREATCTEDGKKVYHATVTMERKDYTDTYTISLEATGHTYGEPEWNWNTEGGTPTAIATFPCEKEDNVEELEAVITLKASEEATCIEGGSKTYTAVVTLKDIEYSDEITLEIEALGHDYEETVVAPTCEAEGYTEHVCKRGDDSFRDNWKDALGHDWDDGVVIKEATETEAGIMRYTCKRDSSHTREEVIPKLNHTHTFSSEPVWTWTESKENQTYYAVAAFTCDDEDGEEELTAVVTKEVTEAACESAGKIVFTAKITFQSKEYTDTKEIEIPALGHDYQPVVTAPTCTEGGYTTYTCSRCGESYKADNTEALGHDWSDWKVTKAASCTAEGEETRTCSRCNEKETRSIEKTAHTPVVIPAVEATCTETGLTEGSKCSVCGEILVKQEVTPALGHDYEPAVTAPTCTEGGYTTYTCSRCAESYTADNTDALGHDWSGWSVTTSASCTAEGKETRTCSRCKKVETRKLAMIAHTPEVMPAVEATCTETGLTEGSKCGVCGTVIKSQTTVKAKGHSWSDWKVTKAATCMAEGTETRTCSACKKSETRSVAKIAHREEKLPAKAATCTEAGLTEGSKCSVCGTVIKAQTTIKAKGHNWFDWKVTKAATCTAEGTETRTCAACKMSETRSVAKIAHREEKLPAKAATCTEAGLTEGRKCSVCGTVIKAQTTVKALGHDWEKTATVDRKASCKEEGSQSIHCSRCDATKDVKTIAKLDHTWDDGKVTKQPTTTTEGERTYTCTVCGETKTEAIPKKAETAQVDKPLDPADAPAAEEKEKEILKSKKDEAPAGATFNLLQLRFTKVKKNAISLKWTKVDGATGYIIYGNQCGKAYKKVKTISSGSKTSFTQKKLKKGKYYKYYIVATAQYQGTTKVIASSKTIHVATSGGKVGNYKSVKLKNVKKNAISLKVGKTRTIKAKEVAASKKLKVKRHRKLAYESTNPEVASVSKTGKIKGLKAGTCYVYVYTQSGTFKKIKVTVKP